MLTISKTYQCTSCNLAHVVALREDWKCEGCGHPAEGMQTYEQLGIDRAEEEARLAANEASYQSLESHQARGAGEWGSYEAFMLPLSATPDERHPRSLQELESTMEKYGIDRERGLTTHDGHPARRVTPEESERIGGRYRGR